MGVQMLHAHEMYHCHQEENAKVGWTTNNLEDTKQIPLRKKKHIDHKTFLNAHVKPEDTWSFNIFFNMDVQRWTCNGQHSTLLKNTIFARVDPCFVKKRGIIPGLYKSIEALMLSKLVKIEGIKKISPTKVSPHTYHIPYDKWPNNEKYTTPRQILQEGIIACVLLTSPIRSNSEFLGYLGTYYKIHNPTRPNPNRIPLRSKIFHRLCFKSRPLFLAYCKS